MTQILVTMDTGDLSELSTVYAVAAFTGADSGPVDAMKSGSILMVNQEGK